MTMFWAILVTLTVLIFVHEYGHYRAALACGVKVLRFSLGFGPVLWSKQRGDTEFAVSALPLGGYVKMLDEREGAVPPEELHRAFNRKPVWQRSIIVLAGPMANLVLAVALYAVVAWVGVQETKPVIAAPAAGSLAETAGLRSGDWLRAASADGQDWTELRSMSDLRWQLMQAVIDRKALSVEATAMGSEGRRRIVLDLPKAALELDVNILDRVGIRGAFARPLVGKVTPSGPAAKAGLRTGDLVTEINGQPVHDSLSAIAAIRKSLRGGQAQMVTMTFSRSGQLQTLSMLPVVEQVGGKAIARVQAEIGEFPEQVEVRYGFAEGLSHGLKQAWEMSVVTLQMMGRMVIGQASLKNISGPVTMADYAGRSAELGPVYFISFLAFVSLSLGVLNLLPVPVLDGGHLMYYLFEGVTGRPVPEIWLERLQRVGLAILILMMSLALYNDVVRKLGQS